MGRVKYSRKEETLKKFPNYLPKTLHLDMSVDVCCRSATGHAHTAGDSYHGLHLEERRSGPQVRFLFLVTGPCLLKLSLSSTISLTVR